MIAAEGDHVRPSVRLRSAVFLALPETRHSISRKPLVVVMPGEIVEVNVRVSPSSTCRPGQVVSRSPLRLPLVPQLAGVPPQLPVAAMVTVYAAAGMDANPAKARMKAANAKRRRALTPRVSE